jgi:hypothetical protein
LGNNRLKGATFQITDVEGDNMSAKFIQFFDVLPGKQGEFENFLRKNYIPGVDETGLMKVVGSWQVATGEGPYHILESLAASLKDIHTYIQLDHIQKLNHLFHFLITNYKTKVMAPTGHLEASIPAGVHYRFNHHYDMDTRRFEDYSRYMRERHIPAMEDMGIHMIGGWHVAVGPGPNIVVEGAADSVETILDAVGSGKYRELMDALNTMVTKFGSKILVPTGLVD